MGKAGAKPRQRQGGEAEGVGLVPLVENSDRLNLRVVRSSEQVGRLDALRLASGVPGRRRLVLAGSLPSMVPPIALSAWRTIQRPTIGGPRAGSLYRCKILAREPCRGAA